MQVSSKKLFWLLLVLLIALAGSTAPGLLSRTRIGLEFKGGHEILYAAQSLTAGHEVTAAELLWTARLLDKRANGLGLAEPEIRIEHPAQIRVMLAGATAEDLSRRLLQGPEALPLKLTEKWSNSVGGVLGEADFRATLRAGVVALIAVLVLLALVYQGDGLIAAVGLVVFLWLMLVIFNAIGATLSLAAIVAFVLGLGIASDANILSFERIRDEMNHTDDDATAVRLGLGRAWRTILDASACSLIVAAALFFAGVGPIRGFALTTLVGIVATLMCSVLLVSLLMRLRYPMVTAHGAEQTRPFGPGPRQQAPVTRFNVVIAGRLFAAMAALFVAAGAWSIATRPFNFDIDFKAGTALDVSVFRPIAQGEAESLIESSGIAPATVAIAGVQRDQVAARFDNALSPEEVTLIVDKFKRIYGDKVAVQANTADPAVANDLARQAMVAVAVALSLLLIYITLRFDWRFALAALVTIGCAVFFVFGMFSLNGFEIDVTFIAALLTVIGFSVNDCVVVFDRLRENLRRYPQTPPQQLAGASVVQVVRRSALTLTTVLIAAASLYFLGAEPLQMFSLAIGLGLLCAGVASLLVGVPVWLLLHGQRVRLLDPATGAA